MFHCLRPLKLTVFISMIALTNINNWDHQHNAFIFKTFLWRKHCFDTASNVHWFSMKTLCSNWFKSDCYLNAKIQKVYFQHKNKVNKIGWIVLKNTGEIWCRYFGLRWLYLLWKMASMQELLSGLVHRLFLVTPIFFYSHSSTRGENKIPIVHLLTQLKRMCVTFE